MALTKEDLILINRTGDNLKSVLRQILHLLPEAATSINGLSRWLEFNRSNCQRILDGVNKSKDGKHALCLFPGIAGLEEFVRKAQHKGVDSALLSEMSKAIEAFASVMAKYARSHAQLKRLLDNTEPKKRSSSGGLSANEKREQHYLASKQLVGASIDNLFSCYILRENELNTRYLHEVALIAKKGISRAIEAQPFIQFYSHPNSDDFTSPESISAKSSVVPGKFQVGVVEEYSTPGLIDAYTGYSASNAGIVFNNLPDTSPFDATFVFSNPDELSNPLNSESNCSSTSISIKTPTKKLTMLVFLEKKLAMQSLVNVGCYAGNQKVSEGNLRADDMWTEKLPEFPELKIVPLGAPLCENSVEIQAMTDYLFNFSQLNPQAYSCYLLEVDYPVWSSTYRIYFEHQL